MARSVGNGLLNVDPVLHNTKSCARNNLSARVRSSLSARVYLPRFILLSTVVRRSFQRSQLRHIRVLCIAFGHTHSSSRAFVHGSAENFNRIVFAATSMLNPAFTSNVPPKSLYMTHIQPASTVKVFPTKSDIELLA